MTKRERTIFFILTGLILGLILLFLYNLLNKKSSNNNDLYQTGSFIENFADKKCESIGSWKGN